MNLDLPPVEPDESSPLAPLDWTMDVVPEDSGSGYIGVVKRNGLVMCHILLAGDFLDPRARRSALARRARSWIADYLNRPKAGSVD